MSDVKVGVILEGENFRDAIHIAVAPVIATETLQPGEPIGFASKFNEREVAAAFNSGDPENDVTPLGIVDPYLKRPVTKDEQFYMFMFPQTITGLRHEWTHPAFSTVANIGRAKEEAVEWMNEFAQRADLTFEECIQAGHIANQKSEDWFTQYGTDSARSAMNNTPEWWENWSKITGVKVHENDRSVFSCSC